jgi:hypothetical protein
MINASTAGPNRIGQGVWPRSREGSPGEAGRENLDVEFSAAFRTAPRSIFLSLKFLPELFQH